MSTTSKWRMFTIFYLPIFIIFILPFLPQKSNNVHGRMRLSKQKEHVSSYKKENKIKWWNDMMYTTRELIILFLSCSPSFITLMDLFQNCSRSLSIQFFMDQSTYVYVRFHDWSVRLSVFVRLTMPVFNPCRKQFLFAFSENLVVLQYIEVTCTLFTMLNSPLHPLLHAQY